MEYSRTHIQITVRRTDVLDCPKVFENLVSVDTTFRYLRDVIYEDVSMEFQAFKCDYTDMVLCHPDGRALKETDTLQILLPPESAPPAIMAPPKAEEPEEQSKHKAQRPITEGTDEPEEEEIQHPKEEDPSSTSDQQPSNECNNKNEKENIPGTNSVSDGLTDASASIENLSPLATSQVPTAFVNYHVAYLLITITPTFALKNGVTLGHLLTTKSKLLKNSKLNFIDLRALHYGWFVKNNFSSLICSVINPAHEEFFLVAYKGMMEAYEKSELVKLWFRDFQDGDVIFYDLDGRDALGDFTPDTVLLSWTYYIQKKYDRHSHSGILLKKDDAIILFHGLASRLKYIRSPVTASYFVSRRIDFSKVFTGYDLLDTEVQSFIEHRYVAAVHEFSESQSNHGPGPNLFQGLYKFMSRRRQDLDWKQIEESHLMIAPRSRPTTPRFSDTASNTSEINATIAPRQNIPAFCSGFTASVLVSCFQMVEQDVLEKYPMLEKCFSLLPEVRCEVIDFTPKDLHWWSIWKPSAPMEFEKYLEDEVIASRKLPGL